MAAALIVDYVSITHISSSFFLCVLTHARLLSESRLAHGAVGRGTHPHVNHQRPCQHAEEGRYHIIMPVSDVFTAFGKTVAHRRAWAWTPRSLPG